MCISLETKINQTLMQDSSDSKSNADSFLHLSTFDLRLHEHEQKIYWNLC